MQSQYFLPLSFFKLTHAITHHPIHFSILALNFTALLNINTIDTIIVNGGCEEDTKIIYGTFCLFLPPPNEFIVDKVKGAVG